MKQIYGENTDSRIDWPWYLWPFICLSPVMNTFSPFFSLHIWWALLKYIYILLVRKAFHEISYFFVLYSIIFIFVCDYSSTWQYHIMHSTLLKLFSLSLTSYLILIIYFFFLILETSIGLSNHGNNVSNGDHDREHTWYNDTQYERSRHANVPWFRHKKISSNRTIENLNASWPRHLKWYSINKDIYIFFFFVFIHVSVLDISYSDILCSYVVY
jgi:hypothetical protein